MSVIRSYSGPHFPSFELNRERLFVSFRSQSECEKMRISITPNTDTFYAVNAAYKVSWDSASLRLTCNYQGKISKNVSWVSTLSRTLKIFKVTLISRARETEGNPTLFFDLCKYMLKSFGICSLVNYIWLVHGCQICSRTQDTFYVIINSLKNFMQKLWLVV